MRIVVGCKCVPGGKDLPSGQSSGQIDHCNREYREAAIVGTYVWVKVLHVIAVISWMVGMLGYSPGSHSYKRHYRRNNTIRDQMFASDEPQTFSPLGSH